MSSLVFDTPDQIEAYRILALKMRMELECVGFTDRINTVAAVRKQYGIKKRKRIDVYKAFCQMHGLEPKPDIDLQKRM